MSLAKSKTKLPVVSIVACLVPEMGIGFQGNLPWRLSKEMKYFRQVTSSTFDPAKKNAVIMGRKTWESIPARFRPLPNRINVVISRSFTDTLQEANDLTDPYFKINSLSGCIDELTTKMTKDLERIYIIGGGEIYNECYNMADYWLITKLTPVDTVEPEMDTFLNTKTLKQVFEEDKTHLSEFLPEGVELPEKSEDGCYHAQEKGYSFEFTFYNKR
ncbi:hypothetical protein NCAS_0B01500 [Naumovozyma castellii]|uniref:Dihydrofolate reductase n=1 Tax=Naumovozyma castellii TaxID=27288 RepID=G0VBB0_NAUCA|nr:hypothetical protein NCAS_0B01500 [Naumovozyma castellii CBS 4309]CCC68234.1 hypothetical protein NCAS_0B01500 [Naumovozyma castellii CBS 4309]